MFDMRRFRSRIASVALRTYLRNGHRRDSNFVVTGYPKSGTTWVTQLAAALTGKDYRQGDIRFRLSGVALHTHSTVFEGRDNILYAVRDPRETVCSAARAMKVAGRFGVFRPDGRITDKFVMFAITELPGARQPMRDHLQTGIDKEWRFLRFEDLKTDPQAALRRLADQFAWSVSDAEILDAIAAFDFGRQKARNKGNAFFAQSALASWPGLLSPAALDLLEQGVGVQARAYGYDLSERGRRRDERCGS